MDTALANIRIEIEHIDTAIYSLLEQRDSYVSRIGGIKQTRIKHLYDAQREAILYKHSLQKGNRYITITKEIIAHSRTLQGLVCYVIHEEDILFAKASLGLATNVVLQEPHSLPDTNELTSLFYLPQPHLDTVGVLYTHATYTIIHNKKNYTYYAMARIPFHGEPISFAVTI